MRRTRFAAVVVALCALMTPLIAGAAAAPSARHEGLCDLLPLLCPRPTPTPTSPKPPPSTPKPRPTPTPSAPGTPSPTPTPTPSAPGTPGTPPAPGAGTAAPDSSAPVFTKTPAQMSAGGLSFTGLRSIGFATVPTVDGGSMRVLKISADSITIDGFALTVRPPDAPGLVTKADRMALRGHVTVYIGSLTATGHDGRSLTIGADTPPALDDVEPGLLRVTMGLVGSIADSISYTNTDQRIVG